jgi:hypothetical protein
MPPSSGSKSKLSNKNKHIPLEVMMVVIMQEFCLLGYDTVQSGRSLLISQRKVLPVY